MMYALSSVGYIEPEANHSQSQKQNNDINTWRSFVGDSWSPSGVMRQILWHSLSKERKQFEIPTAVLARYFYTSIESGVKNIQLTVENAKERELPGASGTIVECSKATMIYWFTNGSVVSYCLYFFFPMAMMLINP